MLGLLRHLRTVLAIGSIAYTCLSPAGLAHAQIGQGTVDGHGAISQAAIGCGESAMVTLSVEGQTDFTGLVGQPVDIMLIVDRSGSMSRAMPELKTAARFFVDIVDSATDGVANGVIGAGTRVGLVSFENIATMDQPLTIDATALKDSIDALRDSGGTNPEPAFQMAQDALLDSVPENAKMIVMFTDGRPDPASLATPATLAAQAARDAGIEIYVIGLGDVVLGMIDQWVSDPSQDHVYATVSAADLLDIYDDISTAFARSSASLITVHAIVDDHFTVSDVKAPRGSVVVNGQELTWTVYQLRSERLSLQYRVTHDGSTGLGRVPVNAMSFYADAEGRVFGLEDVAVDVNICSPLRQAAGSPYMVVELAGSPHLWLADEHGILHWGGDTRAIDGQYIDWNRRIAMTSTEIEALPSTDPLLSSGLVRMDGQLYLIKWETDEATPRLLHVRSLADADAFGIQSENVNRLLLDPIEAERRLGMPLSSLQRGELEPLERPRGLSLGAIDGTMLIVGMIGALLIGVAGKLGFKLRSTHPR